MSQGGSELSNLLKLRPDTWPGSNATSLERLKKATKLSIYEKNIESIPDCFEDLQSLKELVIFNHIKVTSLPESIRSLTGLVNLDLNCNGLTSLPESVFYLTNLTTLCIASNPMTEIPRFVTRLTKLEELQIEYRKDIKIKQAHEELKKLDCFTNKTKPYSSMTMSFSEAFVGLTFVTSTEKESAQASIPEPEQSDRVPVLLPAEEKTESKDQPKNVHELCFLCCDKITKPCALQCKHIFCQACIEGGIEKSSFAPPFGCPVCRKKSILKEQVTPKMIEDGKLIQVMLESKDGNISLSKYVCGRHWIRKYEKFCNHCKSAFFSCEKCQHQNTSTGATHHHPGVHEEYDDAVESMESPEVAKKKKKLLDEACENQDKLIGKKITELKEEVDKISKRKQEIKKKWDEAKDKEEILIKKLEEELENFKARLATQREHMKAESLFDLDLKEKELKWKIKQLSSASEILKSPKEGRTDSALWELVRISELLTEFNTKVVAPKIELMNQPHTRIEKAIKFFKKRSTYGLIDQDSADKTVEYVTMDTSWWFGLLEKEKTEFYFDNKRSTIYMKDGKKVKRIKGSLALDTENDQPVAVSLSGGGLLAIADHIGNSVIMYDAKKLSIVYRIRSTNDGIKFSNPVDVRFDGTNTLYVLDLKNIYKVTISENFLKDEKWEKFELPVESRGMETRIKVGEKQISIKTANGKVQPVTFK